MKLVGKKFQEFEYEVDDLREEMDEIKERIEDAEYDILMIEDTLDVFEDRIAASSDNLIEDLLENFEAEVKYLSCSKFRCVELDDKVVVEEALMKQLTKEFELAFGKNQSK